MHGLGRVASNMKVNLLVRIRTTSIMIHVPTTSCDVTVIPGWVQIDRSFEHHTSSRRYFLVNTTFTSASITSSLIQAQPPASIAFMRPWNAAQAPMAMSRTWCSMSISDICYTYTAPPSLTFEFSGLSIWTSHIWCCILSVGEWKTQRCLAIRIMI